MTALLETRTAEPASAYWVRAAPFRAHLSRVLDDTGLPWTVVALHLGLSPSLIRSLLRGRSGRPLPRLPREAALRLLGLDGRTLIGLAQVHVPAADTAARLRALRDAGCPLQGLARYCRLSIDELLAVEQSPRCSRLTELLVRSAQLQWH